jgi:hypothetical protein
MSFPSNPVTINVEGANYPRSSAKLHSGCMGFIYRVYQYEYAIVWDNVP